MVGHLIQGLSKKYEKYLIKIWGGLPSVRFLRKEDEFYTSEFKKNLKEAIIKYFSLDAYSNECHPSILDKRYQDMFYQCYSFVDQKCLTEQHKSFNATYGFFRGIAIISIIFFSLAIGIELYFICLLIFFGSEITNLFMVYFGIIFFLISYIIAEDRVRERGENFANSIYRAFYAFYISECQKP